MKSLSLTLVTIVVGLTSSHAFVSNSKPGSFGTITANSRKSPMLFASTAVAATGEIVQMFEQTKKFFLAKLDENISQHLTSAGLSEEDEVFATKKDALYLPLAHFVTEYFNANQVSFSQRQNEESSPKATAERMHQAISYGMAHGMGSDIYKFGVSHQALRNGVPDDESNTNDYYAFGCDFFRCVMDLPNSVFTGTDHLGKALEQWKNGENVVFLSNHQSEADPQVVSAFLEQAGFGDVAAPNVYFVAGHKVTTDPLAIPFSMGRNLICIHSKKHINSGSKEEKSAKQRQNLQAMSKMLEMMRKGTIEDEQDQDKKYGCALWVAPSGGRDRRNVETNKVPIADFDSKTIDMFRLMGNKSKKPTHFYAMSMVSYDLCPPPDYVEAGVGETRNVRFTPVGVAISEELPNEGGVESRHTFAELAQERCQENYEKLLAAMQEPNNEE